MRVFFRPLRVFVKRIELDRAVFFGLLSKMWSFIAGPVTAILIATYFTTSSQGYYYTFATILALQIFIELGLGTVTQQFASHEWSRLQLDNGRISGNEDALSRLISVAQVSFRWFLYGSFFASLGLIIAGYFFFSSSLHNTDEIWLAPWISLCVLAGGNIFLTPFWSLLEGCNQVKTLYAFKVFQTALMNIAIWGSIIFGAGLWSTVIGSCISILCAFVFIRIKYWIFFKQLIMSHSTGAKIKWKSDMLPMQWKIAVSWVFGYLSFSFFTPVLFKFQGPVVAGKFGMTWTVLGAISGVANSWTAPKIPQFAILIAKKNYEELNKAFWKLVKLIFVISFLLSLTTWVLVVVLPHLNIPIATRLSERLLSPTPFAILLMAQLLVILSGPFAAYMRAHKEEPLVILSIVGGVLIGASTFFFGKYYSVLEMAIGYLSINAVIIPLIIFTWHRFRRAILGNV